MQQNTMIPTPQPLTVTPLTTTSTTSSSQFTSKPPVIPKLVRVPSNLSTVSLSSRHNGTGAGADSPRSTTGSVTSNATTNTTTGHTTPRLKSGRIGPFFQKKTSQMEVDLETKLQSITREYMEAMNSCEALRIQSLDWKMKWSIEREDWMSKEMLWNKDLAGMREELSSCRAILNTQATEITSLRHSLTAERSARETAEESLQKQQHEAQERKQHETPETKQRLAELETQCAALQQQVETQKTEWEAERQRWMRGERSLVSQTNSLRSERAKLVEDAARFDLERATFMSERAAWAAWDREKMKLQTELSAALLRISELERLRDNLSQELLSNNLHDQQASDKRGSMSLRSSLEVETRLGGPGSRPVSPSFAPSAEATSSSNVSSGASAPAADNGGLSLGNLLTSRSSSFKVNRRTPRQEHVLGSSLNRSTNALPDEAGVASTPTAPTNSSSGNNNNNSGNGLLAVPNTNSPAATTRRRNSFSNSVSRGLKNLVTAPTRLSLHHNHKDQHMGGLTDGLTKPAKQVESGERGSLDGHHLRATLTGKGGNGGAQHSAGAQRSPLKSIAVNVD